MNKKVLAKASLVAADRQYTVRLERDVVGEDHIIFMASTPELPGCMAQGETEKEAIQNLSEATIDYIASLLEDGIEVPDPAQITTGEVRAEPLDFDVKVGPAEPSFLHTLRQVTEKTDREPLYQAAWRT